MASVIYLKINGERQGLISAGASSVDSIGNKYQSGHEDEIFIYELMNQFTRLENVSLHPVDIRKPIDKSTPLLAQALNDKEKLNCEFLLYRTSSLGGYEVFFKISLKDAIVNDIRYFYPHSLTDNDGQPQENVSFKFSSITLEHVIARTSSYMLWSDSIY
ncbi:type VI secretion system protein [Pectobacterium odoriferum]|uniref:Type VI secretion system protein n=1 Tax=Pectobacterium odoriferum TaxID=78398 RepID=A0ABD6VPT5_9GAMM|nr:Hcp family type VI secretion system effector [Pectobacterium odoriferum]POD90496.1 type VI secretion system protein [Pectobacterium odoriferum]POD96112.1 type VI secretion system protein [Pectobacterium odoriferum]POE13481.1 type VI secretion system protein [Pectobacterium odoriferum]POE26679.1 type VI secretion system protein [Pectobacterium odoriferum]POE31475.1 type VI secretion system protein [Pectobacterium odoriferum]